MGNALVVDLIRQMEPHLSEIVDYLKQSGGNSRELVPEMKARK